MELSNTAKAKKLMAMGYRVTSSKFNLVSRVDRKDWKEFSKLNSNPVDADWYRRCISKDTLDAGRQLTSKMDNSNHDPIGYVKLNSEDKQFIKEL